MLVYNDTEYKEYELICSTLPLLCVNTEDNQTITEDKTSGNIYLFDNRKEATQRITESDSTINVRGASSKQFSKKSFKFSLFKDSISGNSRDNNLNLLGLRLGNEYILNSLYTDKEKIREVFSTNLWYESCANDNSLGLTNGYEYKYIELIINGEYQGLYALGYKIDSNVLDLRINDWCYKKISLVSSEFDIDILNQNFVEGYEIKYNNNGYDYWGILKDFISILKNTNDDNYNELMDFIDVDNAIDYYLFINLIQGIDNWSEEYNSLNNMFLTYKDIKGIFIYTPWDLDRTWGMARTGIDYYDDPSINVASKTTAAHVLYENDKDFKNTIKKKYLYLRTNAWSEDRIKENIIKYEKQIFDSGAFARDLNRWPDDDYYMSIHSDENTKLKDFLDYVLKRLEYFDNYIDFI